MSMLALSSIAKRALDEVLKEKKKSIAKQALQEVREEQSASVVDKAGTGTRGRLPVLESPDEWFDPKKYPIGEPQKAPAFVAPFGGAFAVPGGAPQPKEGDMTLRKPKLPELQSPEEWFDPAKYPVGEQTPQRKLQSPDSWMERAIGMSMEDFRQQNQKAMQAEMDAALTGGMSQFGKSTQRGIEQMAGDVVQFGAVASRLGKTMTPDKLAAQEKKVLGGNRLGRAYLEGTEQIQQGGEVLQEKANKIYDYAKRPELQREPGSGVWSYVQDVLGQTMPRMGAALLAGLTTGPGGAFAVGFMGEGGEAKQRARLGGASEAQGDLEYFLTGGISGGIEMLQFHGFVKVGEKAQKILTEVAKRGAWKRIAATGGKLAIADLENAVTEGTQEALQQAVQTGVATLHGDKIEFKEDMQDLIDNFLGGFTAGAVFGAGEIVQQRSQVKATESVQEDLGGSTGPVETVRPAEATPEAPTGTSEAGKQYQPPSVTGVALLLDDGTIIEGQGKNAHINIIDQLPEDRNVADAGFLDAEGNYLYRDDVLNTPELHALRKTSPTVVEHETPTAKERTQQEEEAPAKKPIPTVQPVNEKLEAKPLDQVSEKEYEFYRWHDKGGGYLNSEMLNSYVSLKEHREQAGIPPTEVQAPPTEVKPAKPKMSLAEFQQKQAAVRPAETTETPQGREAVRPPDEITKLPTQEIEADPERFQYKLDATGQGGVSSKMESVTAWNPKAAGAILVWMDKLGKMFVVDGHHRLALAKKLKVPKINAYVVREDEGVTPEAARAMGAMSNLADEKGTAVDAAKLFRDTDLDLDTLKAEGVDIKSEVVKQGLSMKNLSDTVFRMVVMGEIPAKYAAKIGEFVKDPAHQQQAADLMKEGDINNAREAELLAKTIDSAPVLTKKEQTLFGTETTEKSLYVERAKILANVERVLKTSKKVFGVLSEKAGMIEEAGNVLNKERNEQLKQGADEILYVLEKFVNAKGPISEALNEATKRYAESPTKQRLAEVTRGLLDTWKNTATVEAVGGVRGQVPQQGPQTLTDLWQLRDEKGEDWMAERERMLKDPATPANIHKALRDNAAFLELSWLRGRKRPAPTTEFDRATAMVVAAARKAKALAPEVKAQQREVKSRRTREAAGKLREMRSQGVEAEAALQASKKELKGPLIQRTPTFPSIRAEVQEQLRPLYSKITDDQSIPYYTRLDIGEALDRFVDGDPLTLRQGALLERYFGEDMADAVMPRVPMEDKFWLLFREVWNIPRTLKASFLDWSGLGRQGRLLAQAHPVLGAKMAAKYAEAWASEKGANKIQNWVDTHPRHDDAVDVGLELTEFGKKFGDLSHREERMMAAPILEKIPTVRRTERSFVATLNWIRMAVYAKIVTAYELKGKPLNRLQREQLAESINNLSGRGKIKIKALEDLAPLLNGIFFSPRFASSRINMILAPFVDLKRSVQQRQVTPAAKEDLKALGSLAATNVLIMMLVKALDKDDEVELETDLRSADGGKIKVGNQRMDLWTGLLQPARFISQVGATIGKQPNHKTQDGRLVKIPLIGIISNFLRSKENPSYAFIHGAISGKKFAGKKFAAPPKGKPGEVMTRMGISPKAQGWSAEVYELLEPLMIDAAIEAYQNGGVPPTAVALLGEFLGFGIQTYKPSPYQQVRVVKDKLAQARFGKPWDDLAMSQQIKLRSGNKSIAQAEAKARAEREPQDEIDLTEQNKVAERIRGKLPVDVQLALKEAGVRTGIGRTIGRQFRLNDKRFARYEAKVVEKLSKLLSPVVTNPSFARQPLASRERLLRTYVNRVKEQARKELLAEVEREARG